jgi:hypothetical protein
MVQVGKDRSRAQPGVRQVVQRDQD